MRVLCMLHTCINLKHKIVCVAFDGRAKLQNFETIRTRQLHHKRAECYFHPSSSSIEISHGFDSFETSLASNRSGFAGATKARRCWTVETNNVDVFEMCIQFRIGGIWWKRILRLLTSLEPLPKITFVSVEISARFHSVAIFNDYFRLMRAPNY